jgi:hypothetical protein
MVYSVLEARAHTSSDGVLRLELELGIPNANVAITLRVLPAASKDDVDANGWPVGFFEKVAGSMPYLERPPQGDFEERVPLA